MQDEIFNSKLRPLLARESNSDENFLLFNLVIVLGIFCFLKILPIEAESQPLCALFAGLGIFFNRKLLKLPISFYFFLFTLFLFFFVSIINFFSFYKIDLANIFGTLFALIPPIFVYYYLIGQSHKLKPLPIKIIILIWFFVGFSQAYAPILQKVTGLEFLLSHLIPRYSATDLSAWGRGVTLISPEPAHSATIVFLFFVLLHILKIQKKISLLDYRIYLTMVAFMALVNASGTMFMILGVFFLVIGSLILSKAKKLGLFLLFSLGCLLYSLTLIEYESRTIILIKTVATIINDSQDLTGLISVLMDEVSGGRIAMVVTGYSNVFSVGAGLGSWSLDFQQRAAEIGIDLNNIWYFREQVNFANVKPASFFALLIFDCGIVGLFSSLLIIRTMTKSSSSELDIISKSILYTSIILLIIGGTLVSLPSYWIAAALVNGSLKMDN